PTDGGGDGKQAHQEQCSCVFAPLARRHPHRPNFGRARRWRAECCGDDRRAARRCSGGADHPAVAAASIDRLDSRTPSPPPMRWRRHGDLSISTFPPRRWRRRCPCLPGWRPGFEGERVPQRALPGRQYSHPGQRGGEGEEEEEEETYIKQCGLESQEKGNL
ncbi:unnamed protein product, partial [Prorocentrum cordatum]